MAQLKDLVVNGASRFIGPIQGTASNAVTAGNAAAAGSSVHASSANYAANAGTAVTAETSITSTYAESAGEAVSAGSAITADYAITATWSLDGRHASSATYAGSAGSVAWANVSGKSTTTLGWTAGNTSGPTLNVYAVANTASATIPAAGTAASGIVTTGDQSFSGNKSFAGYQVSAATFNGALAGTATRAMHAATSNFASTSNYASSAGYATTATASGSAITASYATQNGIEFIVGTQTTTSSQWLGVTKDTVLSTGKVIAYQLSAPPYTATATLNLTLGDGVNTTGPKVILRQGSKVTTQYPKNTVLFLTYDGTYWRTDGDYDSNTTYSVLTVAERDGGTATTGRTISAERLRGAKVAYADSAEYAGWADTANFANTANFSTTAIFAATANFASTANYASSAGYASGAGFASSATMAQHVLESLTVGDKVFNGATAVTLNYEDFGLAGSSMEFKGIITSPNLAATANWGISSATLKDGTTFTAVSGNVVIYDGDGREYIWSNGSWQNLGLATDYALAEHIHGNVSKNGLVSGDAVTVASGDAILISDSSASNKLVRSSLQFGTGDTFLKKDGTWATPTNTTYSAGTGLAITATNSFVNTGVREIKAATNNNGRILVNTGGTWAEVAVKGLAALAYKASATGEVVPEGGITIDAITCGGSNTGSAVTISPKTTAVYSMVAAGSTTSGTTATLTMSVSNETLTFSWTPNKPTLITLPAATSVSVWCGYNSASATAQVFAGTPITPTGTFIGTATTVTVS